MTCAFVHRSDQNQQHWTTVQPNPNPLLRPRPWPENAQMVGAMGASSGQKRVSTLGALGWGYRALSDEVIYFYQHSRYLFLVSSC